jgi:hypothetical protein
MVRRGRGQQLSQLTGADLLANGDIELRAWIIMMGIIGDVPVSQRPGIRAVLSREHGHGRGLLEHRPAGGVISARRTFTRTNATGG